jgi:hypothetical protein
MGVQKCWYGGILAGNASSGEFSQWEGGAPLVVISDPVVPPGAVQTVDVAASYIGQLGVC